MAGADTLPYLSGTNHGSRDRRHICGCLAAALAGGSQHMSIPSPRPVWTPDMDATLLRMWPNRSYPAIAQTLGMTVWYMLKRAKRLGLPKRTRRGQVTPTFAEWVAIASEMAQEAGIRRCDLLGPNHSKAVFPVRWRAWRAMKDRNPRYSVAGIGRVSGFDATSVRYGLMRLAESAPLE